MALHKARGISHSYDLREISPGLLSRFLLPYAQYLKSNGIVLPDADNKISLPDYQKLSFIIAAPDAATPRELINSLHCIREVATTETLNCLLEEAATRGILIDNNPDMTPIDVAMQVWMHDRRIIECLHVEKFLIKPCTFVYYQAAGRGNVGFWKPPGDAVAALENDLDKWFQSHRHGRGCRVHWRTCHDGIWFLVWHGAPMRCEICMDHGESSFIHYRPETHDVLVYQPALGELQIDADNMCERRIYRKLFGRHFFGDDDHFPGTAIYTLEPLRADGMRSLFCADVPGIEKITLVKIEVSWGSHYKKSETFQDEDVFKAIGRGEFRIPFGARLVEAWFRIRFSDSQRPRMAGMRPSNIVHYELDSDCKPVEYWFRARGFMAAVCALFFSRLNISFDGFQSLLTWYWGGTL